jgi:NADH-ubiquinone oxidoreductase chain 5
MAAPTPISALVHSSTLVTAGLFLIIRFSYFFYSCIPLITILIVVRVFTSFYAGLNTIFEKDLKKLIALSTLSHLGFIGLSFSSGLLYLAFFHMLTHALFKSLLFITIGDIMINMSHSQDIRYLSKGYCYSPFSSFVINVSLFNLLGLPTLSGYFSKDFVLEGLNYSSISFILYGIILVNVFFTYYYTYSLLHFSFQSVKLSPFFIVHAPLAVHSLLMLILSLLAVSFGIFFMSHVYSFLLFSVVPGSLKFFPILINITFFMVLFLLVRLLSSKNIFINRYFSQIMFLTPFILTVISKLHVIASFSFNKSFESGVLNYTLNIFPSLLLLSSGNFLFRQSIVNPLQILLFSLGLVFIFLS